MNTLHDKKDDKYGLLSLQLLTDLVYRLHHRMLCDTFICAATFSCAGKVQSVMVHLVFDR